jgi:hypothetical protein
MHHPAPFTSLLRSTSSTLLAPTRLRWGARHPRRPVPVSAIPEVQGDELFGAVVRLGEILRLPRLNPEGVDEDTIPMRCIAAPVR